MYSNKKKKIEEEKKFTKSIRRLDMGLVFLVIFCVSLFIIWFEVCLKPDSRHYIG